MWCLAHVPFSRVMQQQDSTAVIKSQVSGLYLYPIMATFEDVLIYAQ